MTVNKSAVVEHRLNDIIAGDHGAERHIATAETLGKTDDIGCDIPMLGSKEAASASAAAHDFVMDEEDAVLVTNFAYALHVARGGHECARRGTANRLNHKGKAGLGTFLEDFVFQHLGVVVACGGVCRVQPVKIGPGRRDFWHRVHHRIKGRCHRRVACDSERAKCGSVIGGCARDDFIALGLTARERVLAREFHRAFCGFRAARDKKDFVQTFGRKGGGAGGELFGGLGLEVEAIAEGSALHLLLHGGKDIGIGMPNVTDHRA